MDRITNIAGCSNEEAPLPVANVNPLIELVTYFLEMRHFLHAKSIMESGTGRTRMAITAFAIWLGPDSSSENKASYSLLPHLLDGADRAT